MVQNKQKTSRICSSWQGSGGSNTFGRHVANTLHTPKKKKKTRATLPRPGNSLAASEAVSHLLTRTKSPKTALDPYPNPRLPPSQHPKNPNPDKSIPQNQPQRRPAASPQKPQHLQNKRANRHHKKKQKTAKPYKHQTRSNPLKPTHLQDTEPHGRQPALVVPRRVVGLDGGQEAHPCLRHGAHGDGPAPRDPRPQAVSLAASGCCPTLSSHVFAVVGRHC